MTTFSPTQTADFKWPAQSVLSSVSACRLFFISQHSPPLPFVSLHPASFSTCAGCTPGLQTRLCVFPVLAASHPSLPVFLHQHPGKTSQLCLPLTPQSLSHPTGPQMASRCSKSVGGKYTNKKDKEDAHAKSLKDR